LVKLLDLFPGVNRLAGIAIDLPEIFILSTLLSQV